MSPFNLGRFLGERKGKDIIHSYVGAKYTDLDSYDQKQICAYLYHILGKTNPSETSI